MDYTSVHIFSLMFQNLQTMMSSNPAEACYRIYGCYWYMYNLQEPCHIFIYVSWYIINLYFYFISVLTQVLYLQVNCATHVHVDTLQLDM